MVQKKQISHSRILITCRLLILLSILALPCNAFASSLSGQVLNISTDTRIILQTKDGRRLPVTLAGIKSPPFIGRRASIGKRHLQTLLAGRFVTVDPITRSASGVILGRVLYGGSDVGLRLIRSGLALVADAPLPLDAELQHQYAQAEEEARRRKMGYWQTIR
ncbi:MAG: thermonuclease family protein [Candidatus Thiodiazotropha sp. (ex Monitilora ramsayi)]|nr:thermonuclease family protein [Candidatus Thiodiazotropha sp. (ex Monitilora ramsayi)]